MGELETTVAAPFIHMHATALSQMQLIFYFTQDKRWMGIDDAKKLIALASSLGYYTSDNKIFSLSSIVGVDKIPLGFKPTDAIFAEAVVNADPLEETLHVIAEKTGKDVKSLAAELQNLKKHYDNLICDEAATILLAKKYHADITKYHAELLKAIEKE